jgi:response regulator of citrate/malate metabolism
MDLSTPIYICESNEEFRNLLRDMLAKQGFFHLLESAEPQESLQSLKEFKGKKPFLLVEKSFLNQDNLGYLSKIKSFLILSQPDEMETIQLASRFGVKHIIGFPFTSKTLVERMKKIADQ